MDASTSDQACQKHSLTINVFNDLPRTLCDLAGSCGSSYSIRTCTLAVPTEDPEAEDGLCGADNGLVAPCVPLPVPPARLVLLAPLEFRLLPLLAGTFTAIPLKLFFPRVPVDEEFVSFEGAWRLFVDERPEVRLEGSKVKVGDCLLMLIPPGCL